MRPKSLPELEEALILREAGYTLSAIAERTGISASTLTRRFKEAGGTPARGKLSQEAIDQARQQLLQDSGFIGELKEKIASQVLDDLALTKQIRESVLITLERLNSEDCTMVRSRSLAALSTSLKITSDVARRALKADKDDIAEEFAIFTVCRMSDEEIDEIRKAQSDDD